MYFDLTCLSILSCKFETLNKHYPNVCNSVEIALHSSMIIDALCISLIKHYLQNASYQSSVIIIKNYVHSPYHSSCIIRIMQVMAHASYRSCIIYILINYMHHIVCISCIKGEILKFLRRLTQKQVESPLIFFSVLNQTFDQWYIIQMNF